MSSLDKSTTSTIPQTGDEAGTPSAPSQTSVAPALNRARRKPRRLLLMAGGFLLVIVAIVGWAMATGSLSADSLAKNQFASSLSSIFRGSSSEVLPYTVEPGRLVVTVTERGSLESSNNQEVASRVEGSTTIISILPEGTRVKEGQLVCELDSSSLEDQLTNQQITTESAFSNYTQAKLTREVAEQAIEEYEQGVYLQERQQIEGDVKLAESEQIRARERYAWAQRMFDKGYLSQGQFTADQLALERADIASQEAKKRLEVLQDYTKPKRITELKADVEKALSNEKAQESILERERTKERKLREQIDSCKLYAPSDGLLVYYKDTNRWSGSNENPIQEGTAVRERQKIFSLPDIDRMQVNVKVHESMVEKVRPGQKAEIRVDSAAEDILTGTVKAVAPLPDQTGSFSSDIKVYTTIVSIDKGIPGLRPGLSAEVTILIDEKEDVLSVPVMAVIQYADGTNHVRIRGNNGDWVDREIMTGLNNDKFVEIVQGLEPGETVAMSPRSVMTDEEKNKAFMAGSGAEAQQDGPFKGVDGPAAGSGAPAQGKAGAGGRGGAGGGPGTGGPGGGPGGGGQGGGGGRSFDMSKMSAEQKAQIEKFRNASPEERKKMAEQFRKMRGGQGGGQPGAGGAGQ